MGNIDLIGFEGAAILAAGNDIIYVRPIGENYDDYDHDDLMITLLGCLDGEQNYLNSIYSRHLGKFIGWRIIDSNRFCITDVMEGGEESFNYISNVEVRNVTHEYLSFTYGYLRTEEQLDALWNLASEHGFDAEIDERAVSGDSTARAFHTTGNKIIFSDDLTPPNTIGRKQINFPAIKFWSEDFK